MHRPDRVVCTLAAVVLPAISVAVEEPVDFSGTWVLDKTERSTPPMVGDGFPGGGRGYPGGGGGGYPGGGGGYPGGGGGYPGSGGSYPGGGGGYPGSGSGIPGGGGGRPGGGRGIPGGQGGYPGGGVSGSQEGSEDREFTLLITQTAAELKIERRRGPALAGRPVTQVFALDGRANSNPDDLGRGTVQSRAKWSKSKLVIEGVENIARESQDYQMKIKRELSLSKDRQVLTVKTSLQTPSGPVGVKQTFRKSDSAGTPGVG